MYLTSTRNLGVPPICQNKVCSKFFFAGKRFLISLGNHGHICCVFHFFGAKSSFSIFFRHKRENGSGQDPNNSSLLTSLTQRSWLMPIPWTIIKTSTCSKILKSLVHDFIRCSACIGGRRRLWDEDQHSLVLGDSKLLKKI